jgi:uncharacterized protein
VPAEAPLEAAETASAPAQGPPPGPARGDAGVVALANALRAAGIGIGTGQLVTCRRAVRALGEHELADRYFAARATLVTDPDDLPVFDRIFRTMAAAAYDDATDRLPPPPAPRAPDVEVAAGSDRRGTDPDGDPGLRVGALASARERLRHRRFDRATAQERAAIDTLIDELPGRLPRRRSRRRSPGPDGLLDLERTLSRAMATDGELLERAYRRRGERPRPVVLVLDVSGSMADHARALLAFGTALRRAAGRGPRPRVEVFAFATRLTRVSDALAAVDPDAALAAAAERVRDFDGGTRIGACLDELVRHWGRRGILRGAVVIICSDGLERGDPASLASAAARLRRSSHRLVWVNPLAGDPRYEPAQRGMQAVLPHLDHFLPGHDLGALEQLARLLDELDAAGTGEARSG